MSLLSRHLDLNEVHGILICALHGTVILPSRVKKHFDKHHSQDVAPKDRVQLQAEVDELCKTTQLKLAYADFQFSKPDGSPLDEIAFLELHACIICKSCGHICTKKSAHKTMREHIRKAHDLPKAEHSNTLEDITNLVRSGFSQRYFTGTSGEASGLNANRFFEVIPSQMTGTPAPSTPADEQTRPLPTAHQPQDTPEEDTAHTSGNASLGPLERLQAQLESATYWAQKERKDRINTVPQGDAIQTNPWLAYTRFLEVLPATWDEGLQYMQTPTALQDPALYHLYSTVKSMVRTWQNSTAKTSRYARIRVMQEDVHDIPLHPLETYQALSLQHALPLQKIFVFFYRVYVQKLEAPTQLQLSLPQQDAWNQVVHYLDQDTYPLEVNVFHDRTHLEPLEQLCHTFFLSLIEQTSIEDDFELALVVAIAFMTISPQAKRFREGYNFATDITALKKMIRLASIQKFREQFASDLKASQATSMDSAVSHEEAMLLFQEQPQAHKDQKLPLQDLQEAAHRSLADMFKTWVCNYLTTEYPTPMNWLINTARYLSRFRYGENLDAFVYWSGDTVTVRGTRTTLSKFTSMVHNEYERASALLCKLAFVAQRSTLPDIPWDNLIEDPNTKALGFSVFSPDNPLLAKQSKFVSEQLLSACKQGLPVLLQDLQSSRQVLEYCEKVQEFLQCLAGLFHYSSGQPARGTELLSIHHENPGNGMLRNIFLYQGLVAVVPQYHKGYNRDKSLKVVYRFLPRSIGSLFVWYLWLVRPFYTLIQHNAHPSVQESHLARATSSLLWSEASGTQHTSSKWLRQSIEQATERWMGQKINLSTMRHLLIAMGRRISGADRMLGELSKEEVDEMVDAAEDEERELQAGHTALTARTIYALDIQHMFTRRFDRAHGQYRVSKEWHAALGFQPATKPDESLDLPKPKPKIKDMADRIQCNYKRLLRENFGKQAVFRPLQEKVIRAIMSGETVVAFIAGTGSGKSLTFLLPACFPGYGQTIVIVPLAALRHDIAEQCKQHSIRVSVWADGHCDQSASIILATPECIAQPSFVEMAQRLSSTGSLERIVVDEFHYVLLPDHTYRPHLLDLRKVTQFGVRLTLLSATIPAQQQVDAFRLLGVPTDTIPFRVSTSRPNLAWQVQTINLSSKENIPDMAEYVRAQHQQHGKVLVYCDTTTLVEALSSQIQCGKFHGKMPLGERQASQDAFSTAPDGILVATTAFLVGVHVPNIRAVLWFGLPDHLISFVQGGGRGGRDGQPCVVRMILSAQLPSLHYHKADATAKAMVDAFVQQDVPRPSCRRRVLGEYFDNDTTRQMCRVDEQACDVCEKRMPRKPNSMDGSIASSSMEKPSQTSQNLFQSELLSTPAQAAQRYTTSSPIDLTISPPRSTYRVPSVRRGTADNGSPEPRSLTQRPRESGPRAPSRPPPKSIQTPTKRVYEEIASPQDPEGSASQTFRAARQARELDFNANALTEVQAKRTQLFHKELLETQRYWITHCVVCFVDGKSHNHALAECSISLSSLAVQYRRRMNNFWGKGMCWKCMMPTNSCPRWSNNSSNGECVNRRAIMDAWICLWERWPKAQTGWLERIWKVNPNFVPTNDSDFRSYFQEMVHYGDDYKVNRLCLDVNWITQTYFLHSDRWREIIPEKKDPLVEPKEDMEE